MNPPTTAATPHWRAVLGRYAIELVVIFLGITLSFLFEEWRRDREDRALESKYLAAIRKDLETDLAELATDSAANAEMLKHLARVMRVRTLPLTPDSALAYFSSSWTYLLFTPNLGGYTAMTAGRIEVVQNDSLLAGLVEQYSSTYRILEENNRATLDFRRQMIVPLHSATWRRLRRQAREKAGPRQVNALLERDELQDALAAYYQLWAVQGINYSIALNQTRALLARFPSGLAPQRAGAAVADTAR